MRQLGGRQLRPALFVIPDSASVTVAAYEEMPIGAEWRVTAFAIRATVP